MAMKQPVADFLVVGAGVIGLATALELRRGGARVVVLEAGRAGRKASWAGGGLLFPLLPWDYPDTVTRLALYSLSLFPGWAEEWAAASGIDPECLESGLLLLPPYDEAKSLAWCRDRGVVAEPVSSRTRAPGLADDGPGLWLPQVRQVRNPRLLQALRQSARHAGIEIIEQTPVTGWQTHGNRVAAALTATGALAAGKFVICAGAWSAALFSRLGAAPPITPVRGQMLLFKLEAGALSTMAVREQTYLIPRADGHVLAGSTLEHAGFDEAPTPAGRRDLLERAQALLPVLTEERLVNHWAGLRPGSPGNLPIIGPHPALSNLFINSGHFRYGVTMAPGSARLLASLALGQSCPLDPEPYRWRMAP